MWLKDRNTEIRQKFVITQIPLFATRAITNVRFLISALKWWLGHVETFREVLVKHRGLVKIFGYSSAISYLSSLPEMF